MFKSVRLKNFKCYRDTGDIPLRPLTVLIGANNTGKSTILQSLLVLKQTVEDRTSAPLVTQGHLVALGGFHDIFHAPALRTDRTFGIALSASDARQSLIFPGGQEIPMEESLEVSFSFSDTANRIEVDKCLLGTNGKILIDLRHGGQTWRSDHFAPPQTKWQPRFSFDGFFPDPFVSPPPHKASKKLLRFVSILNFNSQAWSHILRNHVQRVVPHREHVPWYSGIGTRTSTAAEFEFGSANLLAALGSKENVRRTGKTVLDLVNEWACDRFSVLKKLRLDSVDKASLIKRLLGDERRGSKDINIAAMGEGVSQLLPIIASLVTERGGDCLLIEQPEVHLHPALQSKLADLFIEVVRAGSRQVIVETHSEHLLLRIRRRVAEGHIKPENVSILFVERKDKEDQSTVRPLDINGKGHFEDWPKGFFEESYQEAMAIAFPNTKQ
jgi:predicted ATPase